MSNLTFPTFTTDVAVKRSPVFETTVRKGRSGAEVRAAWAATPRYTYRLKLPVLRSNLSEIQNLLAFFEQHRGRWDSFLYVDPHDGQTRRVRFDSDKLEAEQVALDTASGGGRTWQVTVDLITVR